MTISLRIVGIFYTQDIDMPAGSTVLDLLKSAMTTPAPDTTFSVDFDPTGSSPSKISATYLNDFTSPVLHRKYNAGTYAMSEDLNATPVYSVWQYYIFDEHNVYVNRGGGEVSPADAKIADGQSVVFRLINIHADTQTQNSPRLNRVALTS